MPGVQRDWHLEGEREREKEVRCLFAQELQEGGLFCPKELLSGEGRLSFCRGGWASSGMQMA